jgi:hypothetical protein
MKTYLAKSNFPYLMTHILKAMFGNVEHICSVPCIIYKITTDIPIDEIRKCKFINDVREEDQAELL